MFLEAILLINIGIWFESCSVTNNLPSRKCLIYLKKFSKSSGGVFESSIGKYLPISSKTPTNLYGSLNCWWRCLTNKRFEIVFVSFWLLKLCLYFSFKDLKFNDLLFFKLDSFNK